VSRVAVVTGGASGIGLGVAKRFAADGHRVAIFDRNGAAASAVAEEITTAGGTAIAADVDVADWASVDAGFARVRAELGPVEILVTSAGVESFDKLADITPEIWNRIISVNLTGTFTCVQNAVPDMVAAGWGRIVTVSSVAGLGGGGPGLSHYAAAKGGIIAFSKALAHELGPAGITVNTVAPGLIDTPMVAGAMVSPSIRQRAIDGAPVRRIGVPSDIAAAVAYLVSDEASFVTGQVLSPNGGRYM